MGGNGQWEVGCYPKNSEIMLHDPNDRNRDEV